MHLFFCVIAMCVLSSPSLAGIQTDLKGDEGIRIQEQRYSVKIVQLLQQSAVRDQKKFNLRQTTELVIENQLIGNEAIRQFGEDELLHAENRVGFPDSYLLEMQYIATAEYLFKKEIQAQSPNLDIGKFITRPFTCEPQTVVKALSLGKRQEFQLPESELTHADALALIEFQFPNATQRKITLGDIYRQQNVQGRITLHNGDCNFLQSATKRRLGELYINDWVQRYSGLSSTDIEQLKTALRMRYAKDRYLALLGIAPDVHDDNHYENTKAKTITQAEIARYYNQHRDEFKRVTKASGRHIVVKDQALADRVYNELMAGLDFAQAIKKYSQSDDKNTATPGAIDWVYNTPSVSWRDSLFLILPLKQINRPIKAPAADEWEIIMVDKREEEFQGADSEGVRYQVSRILAHQKIAQEFSALQKRLHADTPIHVNPVLMR